MTHNHDTADPVPPQIARKRDATPISTDDTTDARRELLLVLLSRAERNVLNEAERPLLRPLVEAEMAHGQAMIDQYAADAPWLKAAAEDHSETRRLADEAAATFDARRRELADVLLRSRDASWSALIGQVAIVQADNARIYGEHDALIAAQPTSVSHVLVQHDVTRKALADALGAGWHLSWEQLIDRARRTNENAMGGTPADAARCTARYRCELGEIWTCILNPGHNGDHVDASDGNRYWNDHVGFQSDTDAAPADRPGIARCPPLVNSNCPGHVGPPYCERAPSSPTTTTPLDWTPPDPEPGWGTLSEPSAAAPGEQIAAKEADRG